MMKNASDFSEKNKMNISSLAYNVYKLGCNNKWWEKLECLGVACSGGADSIALLLLLNEIRHYLHYDLIVLHFNHNLRSEAVEEEKFVADLAKKLNLKFFSKTWAGNISRDEASARNARYEFFNEFLSATDEFDFLQAEGKLRTIALAHHLKDQTETVLWNLLRGSGLAGLQGMSAFNGNFFRPLINLEPNQLKQYLADNEQIWCEDKSNLNTDYTRNFLRQIILPRLEERFGDTIYSHFAQTALIAQENEDFLQSLAKEYIVEDVDFIELERIKNLPTALIKVILRNFYRYKHPSGRDLTFIQLDKMTKLIKNSVNNKEIALNSGYKFINKNGKIYISNKKIEEDFIWRNFVEAPEELINSEKLFQMRDIINNYKTVNNLSVYLLEKHVYIVYNKQIWTFLSDNIGEYCFRTRRSGDWQKSPTGYKRSLKKILNEHAIPVDMRKRILLLANGHEILWPKFDKENEYGKKDR